MRAPQDFEVIAKVSPSIQPGQAVIYHAWEPFQFKGRRSHQVLTPSPVNPIQMAGGLLSFAAIHDLRAA